MAWIYESGLADGNYAYPDYVDDNYWEDVETVQATISGAIWNEEAGL